MAILTDFAMVVEAVRRLHSPFTKPELIAAILAVIPTASRATLFRLRSRLEREGWLKKIILADRRRLHVHGSEEPPVIVECERCRTVGVLSLEEQQVIRHLMPDAGRFRLSRIYVKSLCAKCGADGPSSDSDETPASAAGNGK